MLNKKYNYVLPLASFLAFAGIFLSVYFSIGMKELALSSPDEAKRYSVIVNWGTSVFVLFVAMTVSILNSAINIWKGVSVLKSTLDRTAVLVAMLAIVGIVGFVVYDFPLSGQGGNTLIKNISSKDLCSTEIFDFVSFLNVMGATTVLFIVFGACSLIHMHKNLGESYYNDAYRSLFLSSIFLVAGVVEIYLQFSMPTNCSAIKDYIPASHSIALASGTIYTTLLIMVYAPVFLLIGSEDVSQDEESHPLSRRNISWILSVIAFPIVTGVIVNNIT